MTITYEPHLSRGPLKRSKPAFPRYQRAFDYSWFNRGVGSTMREGRFCIKRIDWARIRMNALLAETSEHEKRAAIKQRFRAKERHFLRRAHVYWRRGHRVRRAQWHTQDPSIFRSLALLFHFVMQKNSERAFAALSKA